MNTPKPYPEIAVFIVLLVAGFIMLSLMTLRDHKGMDDFCSENPPQCMPANYPGKVVQK